MADDQEFSEQLLGAHSPRALAQWLQTDMSPDFAAILPNIGYIWQRVYTEQVIADDPTLPTEVAGKIALRYEQAQLPEDADIWLTRAERFSRVDSNSSPQQQRERAGLGVLAVRMYTLRASRQGAGPTLQLNIREWGKEAERILSTQHKQAQREHGEKSWDRYAAMLDRRRGTYEASYGNILLATVISVRGMVRATHASPENGSAEQHIDFVRKQKRDNCVNIGLAILQLGQFIPPIKARRDELRQRLIN
jgi:hypothetical protein